MVYRAEVAQLVEHHLAKVRVAGSSPVFRSTPLLAADANGCLPERVSAPSSSGRTADFESVWRGSNPRGAASLTHQLAGFPSRRNRPRGGSVRGDVPKWLRGRSAKPLFSGSIPLVASTSPREAAQHIRAPAPCSPGRANLLGMPEWRNGRRSGLKIRGPQGRQGSTPCSGTTPHVGRLTTLIVGMRSPGANPGERR